MIQFSPHFSLEEMTASQEAARQGIDNTAPADVLEHLKETCEKLGELGAAQFATGIWEMNHGGLR